MTEAYTSSILRVVIGQVCSNMGFTSIGELALDALVDILKQQLHTSTIKIKHQCDHNGRTEPLLDDASQALDLSDGRMKQFIEYMTQVMPVPTILNVPEYPVKQAPIKIHGNFIAKLDPDKPDYVYDYLPSMLPDKEHLDRLSGTGKDAETTEEGGEKVAPVESRKTRTTAKTNAGYDSLELPDFDNMDSVSAGLVRIIKPVTPPPPKISVVTQQPPIPPTKITLSFPMLATSVNSEKETKNVSTGIFPVVPSISGVVPVRPPITPKPMRKPFIPKEGARPRGRPPKKKPLIKPPLKPSKPAGVISLPPPVPVSAVKEVIEVSEKEPKPTLVDLTRVEYEPGALLQEIKEKQMAKESSKPSSKGIGETVESERIPIDSLKATLKLNRKTWSKEVMKERIKKKALERKRQDDIIQEIVQKQPALASKGTLDSKTVESVPILTLKLSPQKVFETSIKKEKPESSKKSSKRSEKLEPPTPTARAASKVKKALATKHAPLKVKLKVKGITPSSTKEKKKKKRRHSESHRDEEDKNDAGPELMPVLEPEVDSITTEEPPKKVPKLVLKIPVPSSSDAPVATEEVKEQSTVKKLPPLKLKMGVVKPPSPSPPPRTPSPRSMTPTSPIRIELETTPPKPLTPPPLVTPISIKVPTTAAKKKQKKTPSEKKTPSTSKAASEKSSSAKEPEKQRDEKEWFCPVCGVKYDENADMIGCDRCDEWFHWICAGINAAPPDDEKWFCKGCASANRILPQKKKSTSTRGRKKKPS